MTKCGWCFTEMKVLVETHPHSNDVVGQVCPNCHRVYLDLDEYDHEKRLDTDQRVERNRKV